MWELCVGKCIALVVAIPYLVLGLSTRAGKITVTPYDTTPVETFEGPDMIPLFPEGQVPHHIPNDSEIETAKKGQILVDNVCQINCEQGNLFLSVEPALKPYVLSLEDSKRSDSAIIIAPGGGFAYLAWEREGTSVAEWLNTLGMNAFVLRYRVPSNYGQLGVDDSQRAISYVRYNAAKWGLNPKRIGFMGFSAGSVLVYKASADQYRSYRKIDEVDETNFIPDFSMLIYGFVPQLSVQPTMRLPPSFWIVAKDDACTSASLAKGFCNAVKLITRSECRAIVYDNGGHGYGICNMYSNKNTSGDAVCDWINEAEVWLRRHEFIKA